MWSRLSRHRSFSIAALAGLSGLGVGLALFPRLAVIVAADLFFAVYLAVTLAALPAMTAAHLRRHAAGDDVPVAIIFAITLATVIVALVSLFLLVNAKRTAPALDLALTLAAVGLGWLSIHLMAAIHYAHLFWQKRGASDGDHRGGLAFPETKEPAGSDFVYFAFVIGMTAQTSDVAITTPSMRRVNLLHAIVSFFFNTVLVAAAVNVAVSLGG